VSTVITIDLDALARNYGQCVEQATGGQVAAVVKADAYGLGLEPIARTLDKAGCRHFFTATHAEGVQLRQMLDHARVYILEGVTEESVAALLGHDLTPVLISLEQARLWASVARQTGRRLSANIDIDTGMTRLGLNPSDVPVLASEPGLLESLRIEYVMTHFACADEGENSMTQAQLERFNELRRHLPTAPTSIGNSAGTGLGPEFTGNLARVGIRLYGGDPGDGQRLEPVVRVQSRILQLRMLDEDRSVGYGATCRVPAGTRVATVGSGYADGYPWALANRGVAVLGGHRAPVIGRISMDLLTLDVTNIPESLCQPGALVDLVGPDIPLEEVAESAGTLNYEILTRLSSRARRRYLGGP
jgi:alanine racemase